MDETLENIAVQFLKVLSCILGYLEVKGSDRLCKVVELSMQCSGKLLSDSFETY